MNFTILCSGLAQAGIRTDMEDGATTVRNEKNRGSNLSICTSALTA